MKVALSLYLLLLGVHIFGCTKAVEENNAGISSPKPAENVLLNSEATPQNTPRPSIESSSPNPRDVVLFDGKNYIKKSGWKKPSRSDTYVDENYDQGDPWRVTKSGKKVMTKTILYGYRTPWLHSEDFYYEGRKLDYLKGKLESLSFLEMSANGKVFMYSISVEKVVSPPSNNESHQDPFGYRIMDADGDGIFETLVHADGDIVVPDWVLQ